MDACEIAKLNIANLFSRDMWISNATPSGFCVCFASFLY